MNSKTLLLSVLGIALAASGLSAASAQLTAGKYMSTLSPQIDEKKADSIEAQLKKIEELKSVDVKSVDSSIHFTVKENAVVDIARITDAVKAADPVASVSPPTVALESATSGASGADSSAPASY